MARVAPVRRCFLAANGHPGYPCTPRMSARDCSAKMDDRAFASYNQFFSNIHRLVLSSSPLNTQARLQSSGVPACGLSVLADSQGRRGTSWLVGGTSA